MPSVRERTYEVLRQHGVTTVFGNPGFTELPFLTDFPQDFTYYLGLQETAVISMADGFAGASGQPVLVNLHNAPGLGNAMGNLKTAYHNKTPLVVTAGQQRRVICATGDGALLYRVQALWTAAQHRTPVVVLALDNAGYTVLKSSGDFLGVGHAQPGLDVPGVDLVKLAEGFGVRAWRVEGYADLQGAFEEALAAEGPVLVSIAVDPTIRPLLS